MKNSFVVLSLITVSQAAIAHTSSASFVVHLIEHSMTPAFALLACAALLIAINKKSR